MKLIPLTQGKFAMVDDEDFEWLNQWNWIFNANYRGNRNKGYARRVWLEKGKWRSVYMQRLIMNTPKGYMTDHQDRNTLNNQRENLRICTLSENRANSKLRKDSRSGVKGVNWHKQAGKWRVMVGHKHIALFDSIEDAIECYKKISEKKYGEFAHFETEIKL